MGLISIWKVDERTTMSVSSRVYCTLLSRWLIDESRELLVILQSSVFDERASGSIGVICFFRGDADQISNHTTIRLNCENSTALKIKNEMKNKASILKIAMTLR